MLRPVSLLPALVAATFAGLLVTAVPASADAARTAAPAARKATETAPLEVTLDGLSPSTLPRRGVVTVRGTITNVDDETWTTVNLYPFVSPAPLTTVAELDAAADVDAADPVGERITDPAPYDVVDELAPGETQTFSFEVARRRIAETSPGVAAQDPGVYWFGVHAMGESAGTGRDDAADGRARTFLPLVPESTERTVDTALVLPVRRGIRHESDGSLAEVSRWTQTFGTDGVLGRIADLGVAAGDHPVSWLVDPAVTDAAVQLTEGNPARSLAPTIAEEPDGDGSESPSPSDDSGSADPEGGESGGSDSTDSAADPESQDPAVAEAAAAATTWLDRLHTALEGNEVLSLPYGDLDVSGAASHDPAAYQTARERAGDELAPWGLSTSPAVASTSGYLSPEAIRMVDPGTTTLVSDRVFGDRATSAPTVVKTEGRTLVVASSGASSGGPGPDDPLSAVAVRQRIVSEAALRLLSPGRRPLVAMLPATWSPESAAGFFDGFDVDWLRLTTVDAIARTPAREVPLDQLNYPESQRDDELDALDFDASNDLSAAGATLQNLLTLNDQVGSEVQDEALTDLSYANRQVPLLGRASAARSRAWIEQRLASVTVQGPRSVILASGSGRFSATLRNGLDEPVTVRVETRSDSGLEVTVPDPEVEVGPSTRSTVLLNASSETMGVQNVTLVLTDTDGTALGAAASDTVPIRSNRVSRVIWLILGTGVTLLFATIVVRLVRRIRTATRS